MNNSSSNFCHPTHKPCSFSFFFSSFSFIFFFPTFSLPTTLVSTTSTWYHGQHPHRHASLPLFLVILSIVHTKTHASIASATPISGHEIPWPRLHLGSHCTSLPHACHCTTPFPSLDLAIHYVCHLRDFLFLFLFFFKRGKFLLGFYSGCLFVCVCVCVFCFLLLGFVVSLLISTSWYCLNLVLGYLIWALVLGFNMLMMIKCGALGLTTILMWTWTWFNVICSYVDLGLSFLLLISLCWGCLHFFLWMSFELVSFALRTLFFFID